MLNSYRFTFGFLFWMTLITFLSLYNFSDYGEIDIEVPLLDKIVHSVFYAVATTLACLFLRERSKGKIPMRSVLIYSAVFMLIYGTAIEVIQTKYTTSRSGEILDFTANSIGIIIALIAVGKCFSPNSRLKWKY